MPHSSVDPIESPTTYRENRWTLQRKTGDAWCSLDCNPAGWRLRMHVGEFSVMAEGGSRDSNIGAMDDVRSRLHALGWSEAPPITLRPKRDRRAGRR
jgi:hypothetical protein